MGEVSTDEHETYILPLVGCAPHSFAHDPLYLVPVLTVGFCLLALLYPTNG